MSPARIQLPHHYRSLDPAIRRELVNHAAADGFPISGVLYLPPRGEPDVCVVAMHPRVDFSRHYLAPALAAGGYALADLDIYPSEGRQAFEWSAATDKQWAELEWAGHYLYPVGPEDEKPRHPQERAADEIVLPWLRQRWPTS